MVVVKTDGSRLVTTVLRYDQAQNKVSTDKHYTYDTGGNHFEGDGFDMLRLRDGRMTEHWGVFDSLGMMQQLGAIPEQATA